MFFYSDNDKSSVSFSISDLDASIMYMKHYRNFLFLDFMANNGSFKEKGEALKEIEICKRKMNFWKKKPDFNKENVMKLREIANKDWKKK